MPELPEVETTKRGITPHIQGRQVKGVHVRQTKLRWPINIDLNQTLSGMWNIRIKLAKQVKEIIHKTPAISLFHLFSLV